MATATTHAYEQIQQHLQRNLVLQSAIAESSAGVTSLTSTFGRLTATKKNYLAKQRILNSLETVNGNEQPVTLGRKMKSVQVGVLPADGSKPRRTTTNFYALPEKTDRRIREAGHDLVPDFYDSWGASQFDRRFRNVGSQNQGNKEFGGNYRLYWNENDELPENENIKYLLGISRIDAVRRFWYGDAFVVRFSEHPKTFACDVHDVPTAVLQSPYLKTELQYMWENQVLETELEHDRHHNARLEKLDVDKEIILQRMTATERDILTRLPRNTLEHLAITSCDDGALADVSVENDPHDPTMVRISTTMRRTALDSLGWEGFSTSQL